MHCEVHEGGKRQPFPSNRHTVLLDDGRSRNSLNRKRQFPAFGIWEMIQLLPSDGHSTFKTVYSKVDHEIESRYKPKQGADLDRQL
jgi:hypothetical protein